jgi:hypothetical protein
MDMHTEPFSPAEAGLARQKTPESIELADALPKTTSGIRKDALCAMAVRFAST